MCAAIQPARRVFVSQPNRLRPGFAIGKDHPSTFDLIPAEPMGFAKPTARQGEEPDQSNASRMAGLMRLQDRSKTSIVIVR